MEPLDQLSPQQRRNRALWDEFIAHYGLNGKAVCVTCGQADPLTLTVGHLGNDGGKHRKEISAKWKNPDATVTTPTLISSLKKRGWPKNEGYALQCANCQLRDRRLEVQRQTRLKRLARITGAPFTKP